MYDNYLASGKTLRLILDPTTGEFVQDEEQPADLNTFALQNPQGVGQPQVAERTLADLSRSVGRAGNVSSRYVDGGMPNPDYIPAYERGGQEDASVKRIVGTPAPSMMGDTKSTIDSLMAKVAAMSQPGYQEAHPDMAYSSREYRQGVPDIQTRPEYKQLMALLGVQNAKRTAFGEDTKTKTPEQIGQEEASKIAARDAAIAKRAETPGTVEYKRIQDQLATERKIAAKQESEQLKLDNAKIGAIANLDTLGKAVGDVINAPNLKSATGWFDNMTANWMSMSPDQKTNARAYIKQLQNVSQVVGLQDLRKAGVAPGSITEREWPKFQAMVGTIDPDLSDDEFMKQMQLIQNFVTTAKSEIGPAPDRKSPGQKADWIARAKAKNPTMSGAAIEAEYLKKFGK
jgi:hypothetical protein